jgi:NTE family protein
MAPLLATMRMADPVERNFFHRHTSTNYEAMKAIGVALGAGGARGLAHIIVLQAFEELGVMPSVIAGTSIGAVIGAGLAAGLTTAEMEDAVEEIRASKPGRFGLFSNNAKFKFVIALLDPTTEAGGLIKGRKFIRFLRSKIKAERFEDLQIPLLVVATDYWRREQVILNKGNLLDAVWASYSLPGLFAPVMIGKELLVDGGLMNPLPYDILQSLCDITVAIDVSVKEITRKSRVHAPEVLFSAYQILQNSIVREKMKQSQPDILVETDIRNVRALEFSKAKSIFEQARPAKQELKRKLDALLNGPEAHRTDGPAKKKRAWPWKKQPSTE